MPYPKFLLCNVIGATLWATTMVSLAWLGGRWIPVERMVKGVVEFGLGALVLVALIVLLPRLLSRFEQRELAGEPPTPES
jgi:membrane protein DedA with SNARE-associated domain